MKAEIGVAVVAVLAASGSLAQGAFTFANKNLAATPPIDAKVFGCDGGALAGTAYLAQAYVKLATDPDSSFSPVGVAVNFRTGNHAGYIVPQVVTTLYPGGTQVSVEMRAWNASGGPTYESAVAAGGCYLTSLPVSLNVTAAPAPPADMIGLQSFGWVPEPSCLALAALGAAALWRRRRA